MSSLAAETILPWVVSFLVLTTLVVIIVLCVCRKKKDSNSQAINERALPDIPLHEVEGNNIPIDNSITCIENENYYGPVNKPVRPKAHNPNKSHAPPPPVTGNVSQVTKTLPTNSVPNSLYNVSNEYNSPNISHMYAEVQRQPKHPYEKLKGQSDSDHDTDEYDDPEKFRRNKNRWPNAQSDLYEPPPVPEKHNIYDDDISPTLKSSNSDEQDDNSVTSDATSPLYTVARQAVAGNIPSAEIPYMTPPVIQQGVISVVMAQEENNLQEAPYTVISVREPLAKVRQQTKQKGRSQQFQVKHSEGENYYSEVPEEEQMYAEISSAQEASHISDLRNLELPPAPPTVESLKSVAQAHSRQASIASTSSSGSCVPNVTSGISAPSPTDMNGLYSVVDKSNKQRKTIHLGEGASLLNFSEPPNKIEDMYAKIRKKRSQSVRCPSELEDDDIMVDDVFTLRVPQNSSAEVIFSPGNPYSPLVPAAQFIVTDYRQKEWMEDTEPGYESVKTCNMEETESDYEKVIGDSDDPGYEKIRHRLQNDFNEPTYEQVKEIANRRLQDISQCTELSDRKNKQSAVLDDSDPGYEQVKKMQRSDSDATDPGYEAVKRRHIDEEPNYESVRPNRINNLSMNNSDRILLCDESEPGYESVKHRETSVEDEDPDYEQVRRAESDVDPGYERVGQHKTDDPDYERVRHYESDSGDPNYDIIGRAESDLTEPGYERVIYNKEKDEDTLGKNSIVRPNSFPSVSSHSTIESNSKCIEVSISSKYIRTCSYDELSSDTTKHCTSNSTQNQNCSTSVIVSMNSKEAHQRTVSSDDEIEQNTFC